MRVGAFARGLLLRGECTMELVLMCTIQDKDTSLTVCYRYFYSQTITASVVVANTLFLIIYTALAGMFYC